MKTLRVLSLGAGVQSTTLALMMAHGEVEPVDCAIFADTGCEPKPVYEHLQWLISPNMLPFPVHIVSAGNLGQNIAEGVNSGGGRFVSIPFFGRTPDGKPMMARRQCTEEYKLKPIRAKVRGLLGKKRPQPGTCQMVIGISRDEVERIKPSRVKYIINDYPLVDRGMRRWDCLQWMRRHEYPLPPKSACSFCSFRSNAEWRWLQENDPASFAEAVATDHSLRRGGRAGRFNSELYLHRSLKPLDQVDFTSEDEKHFGGLWPNECEGMCGV